MPEAQAGLHLSLQPAKSWAFPHMLPGERGLVLTGGRYQVGSLGDG